jgi:hypothetical protein
MVDESNGVSLDVSTEQTLVQQMISFATGAGLYDGGQESNQCLTRLCTGMPARSNTKPMIFPEYILFALWLQILKFELSVIFPCP